MTRTATDWKDAFAQVAALTNGLPVYYGSGAPVEEPHAVVTTKDALSGEGIGYNVRVYPEGDRPGAPSHFHSIVIRPR